MLSIPELAAAAVANLAYLSDATAQKRGDRLAGRYDRLKTRLTSQIGRELLSNFERQPAAPDDRAPGAQGPAGRGPHVPRRARRPGRRDFPLAVGSCDRAARAYEPPPLSTVQTLVNRATGRPCPSTISHSRCPIVRPRWTTRPVAMSGPSRTARR